ncbi:MAG: hypothetical protein SPL15_06435 [Lachnospiraceae bacterium]|nr:hypothetical protein [Lachnospiraceae bacterium]MDY5742613.1 hypothetical protein [Lachnospiraceae bacterium]
MRKKISLLLFLIIIGGLVVLVGLKLTDMARRGINQAIKESGDLNIAVLSDEDKARIRGLEKQRGSVFVDSRNSAFSQGVTIELLNQMQLNSQSISDDAQREKYVKLFREAAVFLGNTNRVKQYLQPDSDWADMSEDMLTTLGLDEYKDNHLFTDYQTSLLELRSQYTTWRELTNELNTIMKNGGVLLSQRDYLTLVERIGLIQNIGAKNQVRQLFQQARAMITVNYDNSGTTKVGSQSQKSQTENKAVEKLSIDGGNDDHKLTDDEALNQVISDFQSRKPLHGALYVAVVSSDESTVTVEVLEDGVKVEEIVVKR